MATAGAEVTSDQFLLPAPDVVRGEEIRRLPVEFRQEPDGDRILFDRVLSAPSTLQVTNHAVSQETHENPLGHGAVRQHRHG
jgi:hypothetical protein